MKNLLTFTLLVVALIFTRINLPAQVAFYDIAASLNLPKTQQKDVGDLFKDLFKIKIPSKKDTSRCKVALSAVPALNYTLVTGFTGGALTTAAFTTQSNSDTKLSNISTSFNYSQYKQLSIVATSNIWTAHNKWNFVGDWRYYHFHTFTYGLGGFTSFLNKDLIKYDHIRFYDIAQREITKNFTGGIGYHLDRYWNIQDQRATEGESTDFSQYGLKRQTTSSGFSLNIQFDNRRNAINAERGTYAALQYRNNAQWLGSDNNWQSLFVDVKQYLRFPAHSSNTLAFWNYAWFTLSGKPPYLDLPNTGFDPRANSGRGYAVGRYRGKNMVYSEAEYRFKILPNGLLGAVVFANAQAFTELATNQFKKILPGGGAGLRLKLNKNSNTNIAVDYAFGVEGSRGFFFTLGEAF